MAPATTKKGFDALYMPTTQQMNIFASDRTGEGTARHAPEDTYFFEVLGLLNVANVDQYLHHCPKTRLGRDVLLLPSSFWLSICTVSFFFIAMAADKPEAFRPFVCWRRSQYWSPTMSPWKAAWDCNSKLPKGQWACQTSSTMSNGWRSSSIKRPMIFASWRLYLRTLRAWPRWFLDYFHKHHHEPWENLIPQHHCYWEYL